MELVEILGFAAAMVIGISLGLIGGGGSILAVPVLVYLIGVVDTGLATAYSLFIVGSSSLVGAIDYMRKNLVHFKTAIVFGIPSITAVFLTRKFIVPAIPETLFSIGSFEVGKDMGVMVFFAVIMLLAAFSMLKKKKNAAGATEEENSLENIKFNFPMIFLEGTVVGVLTGIVGAGGGFIIIPALVLLARLPMKLAVGTSLVIIAAKSLIGFTGDLGQHDINWGFLAMFTGLAMVGIFVGSWLTRFVSGAKLKKGFGWFIVVMGAWMIIYELFLKAPGESMGH